MDLGESFQYGRPVGEILAAAADYGICRFVAGSLIVENIFSINGMGQLAVEAVKGRDRELVLSITWISGFLTLIGYLIADLCYTLVDPRGGV